MGIIGFVLKAFIAIIVIVFLKFFVVSVLSASMEHNMPDDYTSWWDTHGGYYENKNISQSDFKEFKFQRGLNTGDVVFIIPSKKVNIGDIIVYEKGTKRYIHRIISINPIQTKGDANQGQGSIDFNIAKEDIIGKAVMRLPYIGYVKIYAIRVWGYFF